MIRVVYELSLFCSTSPSFSFFRQTLIPHFSSSYQADEAIECSHDLFNFTRNSKSLSTLNAFEPMNALLMTYKLLYWFRNTEWLRFVFRSFCDFHHTYINIWKTLVWDDVFSVKYFLSEKANDYGGSNNHFSDFIK